MLQMWSNVCIIESDEGVALFDVGFEFNAPRILEEVRAITDQPVLYIIYGHGHADHAFGAASLLYEAQERGFPKPLIVAQAELRKRFDRYRLTLPYQEHINRIQFDIPESIPAFSRTYIYPHRTYRERLTLRLGGITLELRHARGETDDHTWLWIPELEVACVSDLWVWSCPNAGNPFKVQRYPLEWARALEAVASKSPRLLLPGHGEALSGKEEIREACLTVARALRCLHDQVVEMLNCGMWPQEILRSFRWPEEFAASPYLAPIYGHPYFIVQALLRQYHGWYDGNPSHLFPAAEGEIAREILRIAGDPKRLLDRARVLAEEGKAQLALHLADLVVEGGAEPRKEALELKAGLLKKLADEEKSLIARNIFLAGERQIRRVLEGL
jgi:alkyl sulfatase BDS1-like metallo-beta-lactamase superfamily hydrolase